MPYLMGLILRVLCLADDGVLLLLSRFRSKLAAPDELCLFADMRIFLRARRCRKLVVCAAMSRDTSYLAHSLYFTVLVILSTAFL